MSKLTSLLLVSAAVLFRPPAAYAGPPAVEPPPTLRLDDRARPTRMEVELTLVPASDGFTGSARIASRAFRAFRADQTLSDTSQTSRQTEAENAQADSDFVRSLLRKSVISVLRKC